MFPYFTVFGFRVGLYGIMMAVALLAAYLVLSLGMRRRGIRFEAAILIECCAFGLALLGAYLLYLVASVGLGNVLRMIRAGDWEQLLQNGGLVFYGGLIGGILGVILGCKLCGLRFLPVLDLCAPAIALAHGFGRLGCLFAGCCYGVPCDWFFCFPLSEQIAGGQKLFPVQLVEAVCDAILFFALWRYARKARPVGKSAGIYLMAYAVCRFVLEFFRYDEIRGHFLALSTSQWVSIPLFLAGVILYFGIAKRNVNEEIFVTDMARIPVKEKK